MSIRSCHRFGHLGLVVAALSLVRLSAPIYAAENDPEDVSAIRRSVDAYVAAYNRHDAKGVAEMWSETGEWVSPTGVRIKGREAIAKELKTLFEASEGLRIEVGPPAIRLVSPDVALEEGSVRVFSAAEPPSDSTYVAIHVKKEGKWRLDSVRETQLPEAGATDSPLRELAWLVGEWRDGDSEGSTHSSVTWTKNKKFLSYSFKVSAPGIDDLEGTQFIGWDPKAETIRSWMFDSDGGFGEGTWTQKGPAWVVKFSQVMADGRTATATNIYTPVDGNHFTWKSVGRQVDGEYTPNMEAINITRVGHVDPDAQPATEAKATKSSKKSE